MSEVTMNHIMNASTAVIVVSLTVLLVLAIAAIIGLGGWVIFQVARGK